MSGQPARRPTLWAAGTWLLFLVASLGLSLAFVLQAPELVGRAHLPLVLWGMGLGLVCALVALRVHWRNFVHHGRFGPAKAVFGCVAIGLFGGLGGAELLNAVHEVGRSTVELPVLDKQIRTERRGTYFELHTIAPTAALKTDWQGVDKATFDRARPGQCLRVERLTGWLGGQWLERKHLAACSAGRGAAGPVILALEGVPEGWRWHRPVDFRMEGAAAASDAALPRDLRCRLDRSAHWLYRCETIHHRTPPT